MQIEGNQVSWTHGSNPNQRHLPRVVHAPPPHGTHGSQTGGDRRAKLQVPLSPSLGGTHACIDRRRRGRASSQIDGAIGNRDGATAHSTMITMATSISPHVVTRQ
jgi:hypothetical protein